MSTLAEIESAIASLTPQEMTRLANLLHELRTRQEEGELEELYRSIGFVPLPERAGQPVTRSMVHQLREEEDMPLSHGTGVHQA